LTAVADYNFDVRPLSSAEVRQLLVKAVIAAFMVGCAPVESPTPPATASASASRIRRPLDATPRRSVLDTGLPPGIAEASFQLDTGSDQGSATKQAGLEVVVRFARVELRQTVASCDEPALGSALGGGSNGLLEVALCGAEFWLTTGDGKVIAKRHAEQGSDLEVANIPLPNGIAQATRPKESVP
jgi:hypothetical protein